MYMFSKLEMKRIMGVKLENELVHRRSLRSSERHLRRFSPGWRRHWSFDTEAQSMSLVRTVIWILAKNHHFDLESETDVEVRQLMPN